MNREQRRALEKKARKHGASKEDAKKYVDVMSRAEAIKQNGAGRYTPAKEINEDQKVMINLAAVQGRNNYSNMASEYKAFVEASGGVVYTAHVEKPNLISLKENPNWLFWSGDLDVVTEMDSDG